MVITGCLRGLLKFFSLVRSNAWIRALLIAGLCFSSGIYVGCHIAERRTSNPRKHGIEKEFGYGGFRPADVENLVRKRDQQLKEVEQESKDRLRDGDGLRNILRYHLDHTASPTVSEGDSDE